MPDTEAKARVVLSHLISVAVEACAKSGKPINFLSESVRLLSQNPFAHTSLGEIQGEIALRAVQWGVIAEIGEEPAST